LFDLAGITCGHFSIPFSTFFGATFIGKAIFKVHIQAIFVILAFSQHHVEVLLTLLEERFPFLKSSLSETLEKQKQLLWQTGNKSVSEKVKMV
jgi:vacuole membrane protein 1